MSCSGVCARACVCARVCVRICTRNTYRLPESSASVASGIPTSLSGGEIGYPYVGLVPARVAFHKRITRYMYQLRWSPVLPLELLHQTRLFRPAGVRGGGGEFPVFVLEQDLRQKTNKNAVGTMCWYRETITTLLTKCGFR